MHEAGAALNASVTAAMLASERLPDCAAPDQNQENVKMATELPFVEVQSVRLLFPDLELNNSEQLNDKNTWHTRTDKMRGERTRPCKCRHVFIQICHQTMMMVFFMRMHLMILSVSESNVCW